jgi:hypothetical protein
MPIEAITKTIKKIMPHGMAATRFLTNNCPKLFSFICLPSFLMFLSFPEDILSFLLIVAIYAELEKKANRK